MPDIIKLKYKGVITIRRLDEDKGVNQFPCIMVVINRLKRLSISYKETQKSKRIIYRGNLQSNGYYLMKVYRPGKDGNQILVPGRQGLFKYFPKFNGVRGVWINGKQKGSLVVKVTKHLKPKILQPKPVKKKKNKTKN